MIRQLVTFVDVHHAAAEAKRSRGIERDLALTERDRLIRECWDGGNVLWQQLATAAGLSKSRVRAIVKAEGQTTT